MIAIATKFLPVTNARGARIKAYRMDDPKVSATVAYDYGAGHDGAHDKAVQALCAKLDWHGVLVRGGTKVGRVYVWHSDLDTLTV